MREDGRFNKNQMDARERHRLAAKETMEKVLPLLNSKEQEIVKLQFGLDGREVHTGEQICRVIRGVTLVDIELLHNKIEALLRIQKAEAKKGLSGMVNVNRSKKKEEIEPEEAESNSLEEFD